MYFFDESLECRHCGQPPCLGSTDICVSCHRSQSEPTALELDELADELREFDLYPWQLIYCLELGMDIEEIFPRPVNRLWSSGGFWWPHTPSDSVDRWCYDVRRSLCFEVCPL